MFGCYFNQDYDVMVENFDKTQPIVPQLVNGYKEESSEKYISLVIRELEDLISHHYTRDVLDRLFTELGNDIDVEARGYTYQQFLIEVLRILKE